MISVWIGFDPREAAAFAVARHSVRRNLGRQVPIYGLILSQLQQDGLYRRPMRTRVNGDGHIEMIDDLSIRVDYDGRVSTQHAIARFLVPHVAGFGWALFMDGDMLVRREMGSLAGALGGLDAIVFTAGIGQHAATIRERICHDAAWLGLELDAGANGKGGPRISAGSSRISAWAIPTNEELMIAQHTLSLLK